MKTIVLFFVLVAFAGVSAFPSKKHKAKDSHNEYNDSGDVDIPNGNWPPLRRVRNSFQDNLPGFVPGGLGGGGPGGGGPSGGGSGGGGPSGGGSGGGGPSGGGSGGGPSGGGPSGQGPNEEGSSGGPSGNGQGPEDDTPSGNSRVKPSRRRN